ncbi:hypothetical protein M427DRAFT_365001 [Gonapodya prolifera JEL478]|uniref:Transcription initiation factor TFIID subunit 8 n=1 Tax=Gonapodya prolifera (strain JEL478) TaxID=1344416 RepID=A0A139AA48_GONPJ|nr:hypothetical protein M427DRAFT_365001 [Gonapodya prolifera JEL478]|eukprot:KXS13610.1 hypothetical protein M427DRAFT_365001 [Gonapodya prolifera JEL478]
MMKVFFTAPKPAIANPSPEAPPSPRSVTPVPDGVDGAPLSPTIISSQSSTYSRSASVSESGLTGDDFDEIGQSPSFPIPFDLLPDEQHSILLEQQRKPGGWPVDKTARAHAVARVLTKVTEVSHVQPAALSVLTETFDMYFLDLLRVLRSYLDLAGRLRPNFLDVRNLLADARIDISALHSYAELTAHLSVEQLTRPPVAPTQTPKRTKVSPEFLYRRHPLLKPGDTGPSPKRPQNIPTWMPRFPLPYTFRFTPLQLRPALTPAQLRALYVEQSRTALSRLLTRSAELLPSVHSFANYERAYDVGDPSAGGVVPASVAPGDTWKRRRQVARKEWSTWADERKERQREREEAERVAKEEAEKAEKEAREGATRREEEEEEEEEERKNEEGGEGGEAGTHVALDAEKAMDMREESAGAGLGTDAQNLHKDEEHVSVDVDGGPNAVDHHVESLNHQEPECNVLDSVPLAIDESSPPALPSNPLTPTREPQDSSHVDVEETYPHQSQEGLADGGYGLANSGTTVADDTAGRFRWRQREPWGGGRRCAQGVRRRREHGGVRNRWEWEL